MGREQHRHDISDRAWEEIRPYTIGEKGTRGGNARDTRQFINGVFWILRTGAPWRDLPETYGNWKNVHRRFCRWRDKGIWEKILEALVDDTDFEWSKIAKAIGKALNGDVMTKLNEVQGRLDEHIRIDDERNADAHRVQILRFNRELLQDNIPHTQEDFIEALSEIDFYERYCREHPEYENNRAVLAIQNIERVYSERLEKHDFGNA